MRIIAACQEDPSEDAQETATGLGISTDRRAPPSYPASSVSPGFPWDKARAHWQTKCFSRGNGTGPFPLATFFFGGDRGLLSPWTVRALGALAVKE